MSTLEYRQKYYQDHKETIKEQYKNNKEYILDRSKSYYEANKEKISDAQKRYHEVNKEHISDTKKIYHEVNKERISDTKKRYREANKERILEYREANKEKMLEYYKANKEHIAECQKQYRSSHPEQHRIHKQKCRAIKRSLPSTLTNEQWEKTKLHFDNRCAYCNRGLPLTQDHFVALSNGGAYSQDNIIPCCISCNSSKSNKQFEVWYKNYEYYFKDREDKIFEFLLLFLK